MDGSHLSKRNFTRDPRSKSASRQLRWRCCRRNKVRTKNVPPCCPVGQSEEKHSTLFSHCCFHGGDSHGVNSQCTASSDFDSTYTESALRPAAIGNKWRVAEHFRSCGYRVNEQVTEAPSLPKDGCRSTRMTHRYPEQLQLESRSSKPPHNAPLWPVLDHPVP